MEFDGRKKRLKKQSKLLNRVWVKHLGKIARDNAKTLLTVQRQA
jgi:hypothetical protein